MAEIDWTKNQLVIYDNIIILVTDEYGPRFGGYVICDKDATGLADIAFPTGFYSSAWVKENAEKFDESGTGTFRLNNKGNNIEFVPLS